MEKHGKELKQAKQPVIEREIDTLRNAVSTLEKIVQGLTDKLNPVLNPDSGVNEKETEKTPPKPVSSQVAYAIDELHVRVSNITGSMIDVLQRLEV